MLNQENIVNNIKGNKKNIINFINSYNNSSKSSSWILKGPKGIGKAKFISLLTLNILKINTVESVQISNYAHPDLLYLKKNKDEKKNITAARVREVVRFFNKTSYHSNGKVVIIDSISELNKQGLNSLLKVLEEPSESSTIFLLDHQSNFIPSTITSRCHSFLMSPLSKEDNIKVLEQTNYENKDTNLEFFSDISNGSPGEGIKYMKANADKLYDKVCLYYRGLTNNYDSQILELQKILENKNKKENLDIFFQLLQYLFLKTIYLKENILINYFLNNEEDAINRLNKELSMQKLLHILDIIREKFNTYEVYSLNIENTLMSTLIKINNLILGK